MKLATKSFLPFSAYKTIETKDSYKAYLKGGNVTYIPKQIALNKNLLWLTGVWVGDNFGARGGSKPTKKGLKTSGRFGIVNNDINIINRAIEVMKEIGLKNIKIDGYLPRNNTEKLSYLNKKLKGIKVKFYNGSKWRKHIGFAVYVNNTSLLRVFENFFKNLKKMNSNLNFLLAGIIDSEGNIDKANKLVQITNKDLYVQEVIEYCLNKLDIKYHKRIDKRKRILTLIRGKKNLEKLYKKILLVSKRKQKHFQEMVSGNFVREVDLDYMKRFLNELEKGTNLSKLHKKYNIPKPTIKVVLRNLYSADLLRRNKKDRAYIYSLASA